MGKSVRIHYTIHVRGGLFGGGAGMEWYARAQYGRRADGRPTTANIERWVRGMVDSLKPGGSNEHIARRAGYIDAPSEAWIVNQFTGEVVARWKAPMFMLINPRALPGTVSLDSKPRGGKEPFYAENLYHCKKCNARHLRYSGIGRAHFGLRQKGK